MRHPWAIAAGFVGALDGDTIAVEPECDGAAPPRIDPVDHRHHRPTVEARGHLADNRVKPAASNRQCRRACDDRNCTPARRIAAQLASACQAVLCPAAGNRPWLQNFASLSGKERVHNLLALVGRNKVMPVRGSRGDKATAICNQDIGRPGQQHRRSPGGDGDDPPAAPIASPQAQPQPAHRNQQQTSCGQCRHQPDIAGQTRDVLCDPYRNIDPPSHRRQGQPLEAQWHQQASDNPPRQCPECAHWHGNDIGERRIERDFMKVIDCIRIGAQGYDTVATTTPPQYPRTLSSSDRPCNSRPSRAP